jgi:hypothetical protein
MNLEENEEGPENKDVIGIRGNHFLLPFLLPA